MKNIGQILKKKSAGRRVALDEKSVFYIFSLVIKEEYGRQGAENVKPAFFRDKKIFVRISRQTWESEIWLNRAYIVKKVNEQLGGVEIADLAILS